jgi:glucose-6-phosphate 1-epimerase
MVTIKRYKNDFEYICIKNSVASAKIALQGAHMFSYKTDVEHLWVSSLAKYEDGKAIRGGVPICWPVFGKPDYSQLNQHGFARNRMWELVSSEDEKDITIVTLKLLDAKHEHFNYECELSVTFHIGKELQIELTTKNLGYESVKITQALHTYFNISDISDAQITGLENKPYFDQLDATNKIQNGVIKIDAEVDRIYKGVDKTITLTDANKTTNITNTNSKSVIVWNPWVEKSLSMGDLDNNGYKNFVCIESANALNDFVVLEKDESHTLKLSIEHSDIV